ncbi:MAG: hypothetical protein M0P11_09290 [Anaerolineaceae bacterium]|nr:hypothetical protein [Anaerolineaceae bacterium]
MSDSLRETILLIVQIASLVALVLYVLKTAQMASETKKSAAAMEKSIAEMIEDRDLNFAPYIVVYFDALTDSPIFDLVIKNTGKSVAYGVTVHFDPPLQTSLKNYAIEDLAMIHKPIPVIPPGYELRTSIDRLENRLSSDELPRQYRVTVSYTGGIKDTLRKFDYLLDINVFHGILETHISSLTDLTHAVEDIPLELNRISDKSDQITGLLASLDKKFAALESLIEKQSGSLEILAHTSQGMPLRLNQLSEQVEQLAIPGGGFSEITNGLKRLDETLKSKNTRIW